MAESVNRQVLLKSRPEGVPRLENFQLTQTPMRQPGEGEVLKRILYLSLTPTCAAA
jgi:NADPH-dependent curcumin reductase